MRKLPIILLGLLLIALTATRTLADSSGSQMAYTNFSDIYRTSYQNYITVKNKYLTYRTLAAEKEALESGRDFLKIREQYIILYLNMLRDKVAEQGGFTLSERNLIISKIDVENTWLASHRSLYDTPTTLDDLERVSDQTQDRYESVIRYVGLQTSGEILYNKAAILEKSLRSIIAALEFETKTILASGTDLTLAQRWLLAAKNKIDLAKDKQNEAVLTFMALRGQNLVADYNKGIFLLSESNQYLKEADSFVLEIIKSIKGE
ncbi:hypothetical protein HY030_00085 [Candidatus Gottesmanbacteria bacterium]|nr:hypothetical protein [Candidatus Gottesmanbacteria bacterium]